MWKESKKIFGNENLIIVSNNSGIGNDSDVLIINNFMIDDLISF
jgi:hypothetical protein